MFSHAAQKVIDDYQEGLGEPSMEGDTLCELMRTKVKKAKYLVLKPATKHPSSFARVLGQLATADDETLAEAFNQADKEFLSSLTLRDFFSHPALEFTVNAFSFHSIEQYQDSQVPGVLKGFAPDTQGLCAVS